MKARFLVLAIVMGVLSVRLQAGTIMPIVDNPLQPTNAGEFSNLGASNQQIADDFVLSQPVTLQSISWFGRYSSDLVNITGPVSFSVRFFDDNGDQPAISPFLTFDLAASVAGARSAFSGFECATANCPWFSYSASLPDILLGPAKYWVSVLETDSRTALFGNSQWLWADTDSTGLRSFRFSDGSAWTTTSDINHAFTLSGTVTSTVPEPTTLTDHFLSYDIKKPKGEPKFEKFDVTLVDQFQMDLFTVEKQEALLTPVNKNGEGISDPFTHLVGYRVKQVRPKGFTPDKDPVRGIAITNQFHPDVPLIVDIEDINKADRLLVPASKSLTGDAILPAPDFGLHDVNHFLCYRVKLSEGEPAFVPILGVSLVDQFEHRLYDIVKPERLCVPVDKEGEGIKFPPGGDPKDHLLCYELEHKIFVHDQFDLAQVETELKRDLCVPSTKTLP